MNGSPYEEMSFTCPLPQTAPPSTPPMFYDPANITLSFCGLQNQFLISNPLFSPIVLIINVTVTPPSGLAALMGQTCSDG